MKKFIIIDRDGVINFESTEYIKSPDEWIPIPGSLEAIAQLNRAGFYVFIATNQSGVARGLYSLETLNDIHDKLIRRLAAVGGYVEEIFFCPHHPNDQCLCRKPKPGLLLQIQHKYAVPLQETFFIGDSLADIQAATAAGCHPLLVLTGNGEKVLQNYSNLATLTYFPNLQQAAEYVISRKVIA